MFAKMIEYHRSTLMSLCLCLLPGSMHAQTSVSDSWLTTWGSSQMRAAANDGLPKQTLNGATIRQVVHVSAGGGRFRLHLSNAFGERSLVLSSVYVATSRALPGGEVAPSLQHQVQFSKQMAVEIPAGSEYVSDVIPVELPAFADVAITLVVESAPASITSHPGARATTYVAAGDHALDKTLPTPETVPHWYFLAGLEVQAQKPQGSVVILGDSITDGHGATDDANDRWTDVLARRLPGVGIVNAGIGGNRVLQDGLGPNALARLDRDVLAVPLARFLIVFEGVNDLGVLDRIADQSAAAHDALLAALEGAFTQMVVRSHARGIKVYGATVTPFTGSPYYHPNARTRQDRQALNQWIRTSGVFDGVIDFDQTVRDPAHPDQLLPSADSGDHLHPGPGGYRMMGEAVRLSLFAK